MSPRLRRLQADYERVTAAFAQHPNIRIVSAEGQPPEKYVIEFNVEALVPGIGDSLEPGVLHQAEVFLPLDYPRRPPFCRMITPVFHPNIDPQKICIGDHWTAGQSLAQMIVHIAQIICYQSYNTKSPLNAKAAAWVEENMEKIPLHKTDLSTTL